MNVVRKVGIKEHIIQQITSFTLILRDTFAYFIIETTYYLF